LKQVCGFWLPDAEKHLVSFLQGGPVFAGGPTYQVHKYLAALPWVRNFRHAVDIGAHCGLWARVMAACFTKVTAFEPVPLHRQCLEANITDFVCDNIEVKPYALGNDARLVHLHTGPNSSGDTFVSEDGEHIAEMRTLDSFRLTGVDFIKIDCEGFELFVLQGGEETIRTQKPCIIVEQKPAKGGQFGIGDHDAVRLLREWGAVPRADISGDYILSWD